MNRNGFSEMVTPKATASSHRLSAVLCGSFRRNQESLRGTFERLRSRFEILSPRGVNWLDPRSEFVRLPGEEIETVDEIEGRHLGAITSADFVWLHCPDGYVGTSASMEVGHAAALGIPIFSSASPSDEVIASKVVTLVSPDVINAQLVSDTRCPGQALTRLQRHYKTVADRRGWTTESAQDILLLLTEEFGELARAIRKSAGISRHHASGNVDIASEIADVQLYLVHLASALDTDIGLAVTQKEYVNAARFERSRRIA